MDEVDRLSVDFGGELIQSVDLGLLGAPVVTFLPVVCEFADFADVSAVFPRGARQLVRPLGLSQSPPQICEHAIWDMSFERLDCHRFALTVTGLNRNEHEKCCCQAGNGENSGWEGRDDPRIPTPAP